MVFHLIVALVLFQQINLTPTSNNQLQAPITIRLISEPKKQTIPVPQPQIQKVTPKPQAKAVMSTPNLSTFTTPEKIQTPVKESAQETEAKVERSTASAPTDTTRKTEEKGESTPVYVAPKFGADYLQNPSPEYPGMSRRRGEQGKVLLKVFVSPQGQAEKILLEKTSGFELLDKSAMDVVKTWKFIPASNNNQPVSGVVIVPIRFSLDS
jgi:protein TonB